MPDSFTLPVFTSEDFLEEASEEKIDELIETAIPIFVTPDEVLFTETGYRALAEKLVQFGVSRQGLMNATSSVFGAWKHPKAFMQNIDKVSGGLEWIEVRIYADMYYDAYRAGSPNDITWSWNTDAKIYAHRPAPKPEKKLLLRFRVLDLFFQLIGSPIQF